MALQDENRQLRETTQEYLATMRNILDSHAEIEGSIEMYAENEKIKIENLNFQGSNEQ